MAVTESAEATADGPYNYSGMTLGLRAFAWAIVCGTFAFLINVYLNFWQGWPGAGMATSGGGGRAAAQLLIYASAILAPIALVMRSKEKSLREEGVTLDQIARYIIRAAFWMALFVGMVDMVISFLRVEGFLASFVGDSLTTQLGRSQFRGTYVHIPLIVLSLVVAAFTRTLGFTWLALLVVVAELLIVITRFIFSYEQAFMGDLVRFWYAGLFLFASAYTLAEEGHVRVDVLYAGFQQKTRGLVNVIGSIFLGISLCWVIIVLGMGGKSSIITSPLLTFEVSQSGFGMYVKYLMASFLAIFAVSMMIQFAGYMLEAYADYRGDPGNRKLESAPAH
ncbi:MAG: TRAP transporter small permease subunit [Alphaproteobacteria bacterium]|nr:TRAP transporter small permease subunit [Alphaproteobacteria bacterium]